MRWPLTISGLTVIESVARPGPISTIAMPRPLLASSSFHIASAQARARSSGESVALTFTAVSMSGLLRQASRIQSVLSDAPEVSTLAPSFRDGPQDQTRNLEIPGSRFAPRNDD